jgi:hypothetical protein
MKNCEGDVSPRRPGIADLPLNITLAANRNPGRDITAGCVFDWRAFSFQHSVLRVNHLAMSLESS